MLINSDTTIAAYLQFIVFLFSSIQIIISKVWFYLFICLQKFFGDEYYGGEEEEKPQFDDDDEIEGKSRLVKVYLIIIVVLLH